MKQPIKIYSPIRTVAPSRERELKRLGCKGVDYTDVAPSRERELKHIYSLQYYNNYNVAPSRERELKLIGVIVTHNTLSRSLTGA